MDKLDLEKAVTRDHIANICWIIEKAREFQKDIFCCFVDYSNAFDCADHNKLWKILKQIGMPDHPTCLLRNLYLDQEATVKTQHGTMDWFKIRKEYAKAVYCHPVYLTLYAEYIMRNARLVEARAGINIAG